jgi:single-strand DNA-binding protein
MSGEPLITIVGNATSDAELRYTAGGLAVAAFTVAVTPRVKQGNEWKDGDTTFFRCTAWREMAEQVAETVTKGMRLIVHGRFKTRQYEKDGQTRTSVEIDVEEVGPSLKYATAQVKKMSRSSGGTQGGGQSSGGGFEDPWATSAPAGSAASDFDSEPPF